MGPRSLALGGWTWSFTTKAESEPTTPSQLRNLPGHIAYNLARKAPDKDTIRLRRKTARWGDEHLASLIAFTDPLESNHPWRPGLRNPVHYFDEFP
jgi:hypothetical protein